MKVFIIAEAGVNHNGDLNLAKQLIDVAADAGADAVKFQTFLAEQLVSRNAPKAEYQTRTTDKAESQFEMIRKLELTESDHEALIAHACSRGITFLSTPFDVSSLHLLVKRFRLQTIKIPSGEITNAPFLFAIARVAQRVILSTGMSTLGDVEAALGVLAFGFTAPVTATPQRGDFEQAFASETGQQALRDRVTLLHCTTEYPAPFGEVNLLAMDTMATAFGLPVGYSDHTPGIHISLAAVARGAQVIEKRRLFDRYRSSFADVTGVRLVAEPAGCRSNYWLQTLLLDESLADQRDAVLTATNDAGLMTRPVWTLMHRMPMYSSTPKAPLPVAE